METERKKITRAFFGGSTHHLPEATYQTHRQRWGLTGGTPPKDAALHDLDTWLERAQNEEADSAGDRPGMDGSQGMGLSPGMTGTTNRRKGG